MAMRSSRISRSPTATTASGESIAAARNGRATDTYRAPSARALAIWMPLRMPPLATICADPR